MCEKSAKKVLIFRILGFVISAGGIVLHEWANTQVGSGFMIRHNLAYFTIQTNIFTAMLFAVLIFRTVLAHRREGTWTVARVSPGLQLGLTFYITVTMLGFWLILAPTTGIPRNPFLFTSTLILHTVTPLLAIWDYVRYGLHGRVTKKHAVLWLSYPAAYLVFVMIFSRTIREPYYSFLLGEKKIDLMYPYPFLDPAVMGAWGVLGAVAGLVMVFLLLGLGYVYLDRRLAKRK